MSVFIDDHQARSGVEPTCARCRSSRRRTTRSSGAKRRRLRAPNATQSCWSRSASSPGVCLGRGRCGGSYGSTASTSPAAPSSDARRNCMRWAPPRRTAAGPGITAGAAATISSQAPPGTRQRKRHRSLAILRLTAEVELDGSCDGAISRPGARVGPTGAPGSRLSACNRVGMTGRQAALAVSRDLIWSAACPPGCPRRRESCRRRSAACRPIGVRPDGASRPRTARGQRHPLGDGRGS